MKTVGRVTETVLDKSTIITFKWSIANPKTNSPINQNKVKRMTPLSSDDQRQF